MTSARPAALALAALALAPGPSRADAGPKLATGWYLPVGVGLGAALHPDEDNGLTLGAEVSAVWFDDQTAAWFGAYADALYDFGPGGARLSLGPEAGWAIFGLDGGLVLDFTSGELRTGFALRPVVTLGILALYGRWVHLDSGDERNFGEVGLLFKLPARQPAPAPRPPVDRHGDAPPP